MSNTLPRPARSHSRANQTPPATIFPDDYDEVWAGAARPRPLRRLLGVMAFFAVVLAVVLVCNTDLNWAMIALATAGITLVLTVGERWAYRDLHPNLR